MNNACTFETIAREMDIRRFKPNFGPFSIVINSTNVIRREIMEINVTTCKIPISSFYDLVLYERRTNDINSSTILWKELHLQCHAETSGINSEYNLVVYICIIFEKYHEDSTVHFMT